MKKESLTQTAIIGILKSAPMLLLIAMLISFILSAIVQVFFYTKLFGDKFGGHGFGVGMAICIGLLVQFIRVALGVSGAREFQKENYSSAAFGILVSFAVTVWETREFRHIIEELALSSEKLIEVFGLILYFVLWIGFVLEVRLALIVSSNKDLDHEVKEESQKTPPARQEHYQDVDENLEEIAWLIENGNPEENENTFSQNGNRKKGKVFQ